MADLMQRRLAAREIFGDALRAVDAGAAVRRAVQFNGTALSVGNLKKSNRCIYAIAFGKAATMMATALDQIMGESLTAGLLVEPARLTFDYKPALPKPWLCCTGGHPLPTYQSLFAAERALELLDRANAEHALVIFLISGGGSAMIEWPINPDITLANLRMANELLVGCGASISEINTVRRAFSFLKGGRLAEKVPNCEQLTLIVSDVLSGEEWDVASGPTWSPPADAPPASDVVERYELRERLPASIMRAIENATRFSQPHNVRQHHFVLLDNETALQAAANAARERGFATEIAHDITDEPIEVGCEKLLTRLNELQNRHPHANVCLISGGEFACPVRGEGMGGRNSETALRLALAVDKDRERYKEFVALCAGTDGIDGNSLAAGALADSTTIERARDMNLDVSNFLDNSASAALFEVLEDAIETGLTGTNVRDVRILLSAPHKVK
jgi:hydroxypyruvate reductase